MPWIAFVTAGIASIVVGLTAISYHTVKAANGNMVEAVKWEWGWIKELFDKQCI